MFCDRKPNQCLKIREVRHCEAFRRKSFSFFFQGPVRIIIAAGTNHDACIWFPTRADTVVTYCYVKRLQNSLEKLIREYKR